MPMDYTTLTGPKSANGSIRRWIGRDDLPVETIVDEAEAYIFRDLRVRQMITTATGTAVAGATSIPLPDDYRQLMTFQWIIPEQITPGRSTPEQLDAETYRKADGTFEAGLPMQLAVTAAALEFSVAVDIDRQWFMRVMADPPRLSEAAPSHFLCKRAPRLLRAACMAFGCEFMRDQEGKAYWLSVADGEVLRLNAEYDMERGGATMTVRPV